MARKTPLKSGAPRLLGDHRGHEGKVYRKVFDQLAAEYGPLSPVQAMAAGRVAARWVHLMAASGALATAQRTRRIGRGRRPNVHAIERLSRREGLNDSQYAQAFREFLELSKNGKRRQPTSGTELLERMRAGGGA